MDSHSGLPIGHLCSFGVFVCVCVCVDIQCIIQAMTMAIFCSGHNIIISIHRKTKQNEIENEKRTKEIICENVCFMIAAFYI